MAIAKFSPGFRMSAGDSIILAVGAIAALALASIDTSWSLAIALPVAHFFLFCNVFRVSRAPELLWAGIFVLLAGPTIAWGVPGWWATAIVAVLVMVTVVVAEMLKPSYHGIGWQRINPGLRDWWEVHGPRVPDGAAEGEAG